MAPRNPVATHAVAKSVVKGEVTEIADVRLRCPPPALRWAGQPRLKGILETEGSREIKALLVNGQRLHCVHLSCPSVL